MSPKRKSSQSKIGISYIEAREGFTTGGIIKADGKFYRDFPWGTPLGMLPAALAGARDASLREGERRTETAGARRTDANRDSDQGAPPRRSPRRTSPPARR